MIERKQYFQSALDWQPERDNEWAFWGERAAVLPCLRHAGARGDLMGHRMLGKVNVYQSFHEVVGLGVLASEVHI
jgi:hypothetical protein